MIGPKDENFSNPICTGSYTVLYEGQLCYSFHFNKTEHNIHQGREDGLKLLIDFNQDRDLANNLDENPHDHDSELKSNLFKSIGKEERALHPENDITIHINTLSPYRAIGGGIFKISGIKQMETTADFDKLDSSAKQCQNKETFNSCYNNVLHEAAFKACLCEPVYFGNKVNLICLTIILSWYYSQ